jgi:hypothetical protein
MGVYEYVCFLYIEINRLASSCDEAAVWFEPWSLLLLFCKALLRQAMWPLWWGIGPLQTFTISSAVSSWCCSRIPAFAFSNVGEIFR